MTSLYFDNSLYENKMHYQLSKYLDEGNVPEDYEDIRILADSETEYNESLDKLYHAKINKFIMSGTRDNPMEIIIEDDPRNKYRKFDEDTFLMKDGE